MAFGFEDFGSDVIGSAADCFPLFACELQLGGESEIAHLDFHALIKKQISEFEIPMYNFATM